MVSLIWSKERDRCWIITEHTEYAWVLGDAEERRGRPILQEFTILVGT